MRILGISAYHRDAAAALLVDGKPVAAAREEWFTRAHRDAAFPSHAIRYCLDAAGIAGTDVDRAVFYEKPLRRFEREIATQMRAFPRSARSFAHGMFAWLGDRLWVKNRIVKELGIGAERVLFTEHQLALAANAFYTSPCESAAVLTIDDVGEWATAALGTGTGRDLAIHHEVTFPHSLGLLASAITQFLGFTPGEDEHKVEALAAHGAPRFADAMRSLAPEGSDGNGTHDGGDRPPLVVDQRRFRFAFDTERLCTNELEALLGPPRFSGDPLCIEGDSRHADLAASLQLLLEERAMDLAKMLHERHPATDLCFSGQLAANAGVRRKLSTGPFDRVFVPRSTGKAGGALGAALYVLHATEQAERTAGTEFVHLGPAPNLASTEFGIRAVDIHQEIVHHLRDGACVAWVRGPTEFADHATRNRIVLARADAPAARTRLLGSLQHSEAFLPCRIAVPAEREDLHAPFAIHVDAADDPEFHAVLTALDHPVLLLADLRRRGDPIAHDAATAIDAFERSALDVLVLGDRFVAAPGVEAAR